MPAAGSSSLPAHSPRTSSGHTSGGTRIRARTPDGDFAECAHARTAKMRSNPVTCAPLGDAKVASTKPRFGASSLWTWQDDV
jgi:hypothetical protein